jgi:deoxyadenosine/deoxycytidine kinase
MKYVSISGAVAAGKSTLLARLLERLGDRASAHVERPENNPFILPYYEDPPRWSFHSQISFLSLYFDDDTPKDEREFYFYDRCLIENLVIARYRLEEGDLTQAEYSVIEKMAQGIEKLMPPIEKYIYLRCSADLLVQRLRERDRSYESDLGMAYASKQKALYDAWAKTLPQDKVLVVDEDEGVDLEKIVRFLEE